MNIYGIAGIVGVCILVAWFLLYVLSWVGQYIWVWVDDTKVCSRNKFIELLATKVYGYKVDPYSICEYTKNEGKVKSDGEGIYFLSLLVVAFFPVVVVFLVDFYYLTLGLVLCTLVAVLARFTRRLNKKMDSHTSDGDAHKGESK